MKLCMSCHLGHGLRLMGDRWAWGVVFGGWGLVLGLCMTVLSLCRVVLGLRMMGFRAWFWVLD